MVPPELERPYIVVEVIQYGIPQLFVWTTRKELCISDSAWNWDLNIAVTFGKSKTHQKSFEIQGGFLHSLVAPHD